MNTLEGKVAIVSGGSRDIGKAVSLKLAKQGAKVVVNYFNNASEGEATVAAIKDAGGEAIAVKGDMTKQADVENLVTQTRKAFGDSIDILINVVGGLMARKPLAEMDEEFFEYVLKLNMTSVFLTSKAVVPHMGEGGSIVNFGSYDGFLTDPGFDRQLLVASGT